jgi:hypothetical protein
MRKFDYFDGDCDVCLRLVAQPNSVVVAAEKWLILFIDVLF